MKSGNHSPAGVDKTGDGNRKVPPLEKLFCNLLTEIYWIEKQLPDTWKIMREAATSEFLKDSFDDCVYETQEHIARLEIVFVRICKPAEQRKCNTIESLLQDGQRAIKETVPETLTRDVALIIAAQKIEHYKIAVYGSLVQMALTIELGNVADLVDDSLIDEIRFDHLLTQHAEYVIGEEADGESGYSWVD